MNRAIDEVLAAFNALEDAVYEYLHEAHNETLIDVIDCDHHADVCWCRYKESYKKLIAALYKNSKIKSVAKNNFVCKCD